MIRSIIPRLLGVLLVFLAVISAPAYAHSDSDSMTVSNVLVYMGLLPTEMIRGHAQGHPEVSMHGGQPHESGEYHVVIALFDAKTGARITGAEVTARVSEVGLSGEEKKLEPMQIAGTETYGNYFRMPGKVPFLINVTARIPGESQEIKATFEHRHQ
jgi:hypothetical protein